MPYSHKDQKKYLEELKRFERNFTESEKYEYKMFLKRHKDEEELDSASMKKLKALYDTYMAKKKKPNYDHLFKKKDSE